MARVDLDEYFDKFVQSLVSKESSEIERELGQCYFDLLFIQTQMEVSRAQGNEEKSIAKNGEKRLLLLQSKIEAMKKELFNRSKFPVSR
jgi:hypothetical protein